MATGVTDAPYTRDILRLAAEVPGRVTFGEIGEASELRSRSCGAKIAVAVELDDEGNVRELRQAVEACAFGQASAAIMAANAKGMNAAGVAEMIAAIEAWLAGGAVPFALLALAPVQALPGRHEAVLLPFRALKRAIEEAAR